MSPIFKRLTLPVAGVLAVSLTACADTGQSGQSGTAGAEYPSQPIQMVVGFAAGGSSDIGARLIAQELEEKLDATISVVNQPGANAQTAYTTVAQAEPDGYTLGAVNFPSAIITVLDESRNAPYDHDSFAPVALQVIDPTAVGVAPDSEINTPEDLVAAAEEAPGELLATTTGVASNEHFALAQLRENTGADIAPVHFSEGAADATTAFLGGNVDMLLGNVSDLQPLVESGQVKVVGVMEAERSPFMPDIPTFEESGFDVQISSSRGFAFPAGTPDEIITQVSEAIGEIMADPEFEQQMIEQGLAPAYKPADEFGTYWDELVTDFTELFPLVSEEQR